MGGAAETGFLASGSGARKVGQGLLALVAVVALATGCEASIGLSKSLEKDKVEQEAAKQIAAQMRLPQPVVTCPDDLEAEVGATLECSLVSGASDGKRPVLIEVVAVDEEGKASFDISVGTPGAKPTTS